MAKTINTVKARVSLTPRRDPYWTRLSKRKYLGYRKMAMGSSGTWLARLLDEVTNTQQTHPLGDFGSLPDNERYDAAKKAAETWFEHRGAGGSRRDITVGEACRRLVQKYRDDGRENAARDAAGRFRRWVHSDEKLDKTPLQKLTAGTLSDWRVKLAKTPVFAQDKTVVSSRPRSNSTLNRDMAVFKTALNLAFEDGFVTAKQAWASKLKPVPAATGRRDCYLDLAQRKALIEHAPPDLAILIRAMCSLPMRPGAVAAFTVSNFDKRLNALTVGKDKAGKDRKITLPASTASFFSEQAKGKLPSAPLFARADGSAWNKDSWKYKFKAAVKAAGLPAAATAYSLRHSTITDLIAGAGLDVLTVAMLAGTSLQMIEKHYGHLLQGKAAAALASLSV